MQLLNDTREICYLTQIVFRLFEDTGRSMDDPRRFRVEILFSAGATATPFHMAESTRESDTTRLDTEVLHAIGRDNLTCTEVEAFFASIISEGGNGDDQFDVASVTTADLARENPTSKATKSSKDDIDHVVENVAEKPVTNDAYQGTTTMGSGNPIESTQMENTIETSLTGDTDDKLQFATPSEAADTEPSTASSIPSVIFSSESSDTIKASNAKPTGMERGSAAEVFRTKDDAITAPPDDKESPKDKEDKHNGGDSPSSREVTHKYFYITVAMGTLLLGASCLIMALGLTGGSSPRYRRQFTRR
jgi:inositol hexakisphosphate/diphosphoinositol-pentakisphosphate kinase